MNYRKALVIMPAPGNGCHPHLMTVANLGVIAGLTRDQMAVDIQTAIPPGGRHVPDREIFDAIDKALREAGQMVVGTNSKSSWRGLPERPQLNADVLRASIMSSRSPNEADLWEASPVRLDGPPEDDAILLLQHLYRPDDFLFIGDTFDKAVLPVREWLRWIKDQGTTKLPHIIPNPLTGQEYELVSGKKSRRCDAAVCGFRYAVIEFDNMSREDQLRFWSGWINTIELPSVACLIDSGGKSIHAWVEVNAPNREAWTQHIEQGLFRDYLTPIGVDPACRNESRLSRLPGHKRNKTGRWQRLLWLGPKPDRGNP